MTLGSRGGAARSSAQKLRGGGGPGGAAWSGWFAIASPLHLEGTQVRDATGELGSGRQTPPNAHTLPVSTVVSPSPHCGILGERSS